MSWKEERELEGIEEVILNGESDIEKIEATLNDPNFYQENAERAAEVTAKLEAKRAEVAALYTRWELLEAKKEASQ